MDEWCEQLLTGWLDDDSDDDDDDVVGGDLAQERCFVRGISTSFKDFLEGKATIEAVASSIAAMIKSQPESIAVYFLENYYGFLFEAAATSPVEPSDLADATRLLAQKLPSPFAEKFQREITWNARDRWDRWRDGFEGFSKSEDMNMEIKLMAEEAWREMCDLERAEPG